VVALTKIDLVDPGAASGVIDQVRAKLRGTTLESLPIIPVSALTSAGIEDLRKALDEIPSSSGSVGRPRLWVDRAFGVAGAGTVVTGTLTGGSLGVGDVVEIWPTQTTVRVRALETNDRTIDEVSPHSRVAVNLAGPVTVGRGSLLAAPGQMTRSSRWLVDLRPARYEPELIERGSFLLYLGTLGISASVRLLEDGLGVVQVDEKVPAEAGNHFILRETGRQRVTAGGVVLMPSPPREPSLIELGRKLRRSLVEGPDAVASVILSSLGHLDSSSLANWSGGGTAGISVGEVTIAVREVERMAATATALVEEYRAQHPLEPGIGLGTLARSLSLTEDLARLVVERSAELEMKGSVVSRVGVEHREVAADSRWPPIREKLRALDPPPIRELGIGPDLLRALTRSGEVVRVSDDLVYLPEEIDEVITLVRTFDSPFTVSEFRTRAGVSRKYAVPLLEYTDREGITLRQGDLRTARR
jgi:selenocysteine-specific elongation factor